MANIIAGKAKDEPAEKIVALDEGDIALLKSYGQGPYAFEIKKGEKGIQDVLKRVNEKLGNYEWGFNHSYL